MYFIALVLPPELDQKVLKYKTWIFEKYGCAVGLKSPAHITLIAPFWMEEEQEVGLIKDIENFSGRKAFEISTRQFSSFKPRTIFIQPEYSKELENLKREMDAYFGERKEYKIVKDNRPFHPHITIATRDLRKKDFAEAWVYFTEKEFPAKWMAESISLLRHNQKKWEVIYTSHFKDLSETT